MQLDARKINWRLLFWISLLLLPTLVAIWFALNIIRVHTYDYAMDYQRHLGDFRQNLFRYAVESQTCVVWAGIIDTVLCPLLAVIAVIQKIRGRRAQLHAISN